MDRHDPESEGSLHLAETVSPPIDDAPPDGLGGIGPGASGPEFTRRGHHELVEGGDPHVLRDGGEHRLEASTGHHPRARRLRRPGRLPGPQSVGGRSPTPVRRIRTRRPVEVVDLKISTRPGHHDLPVAGHHRRGHGERERAPTARPPPPSVGPPSARSAQPHPRRGDGAPGSFPPGRGRHPPDPPPTRPAARGRGFRPPPGAPRPHRGDRRRWRSGSRRRNPPSRSAAPGASTDRWRRPVGFPPGKGPGAPRRSPSRRSSP
jgi:hypothetical protein